MPETTELLVSLLRQLCKGLQSLSKDELESLRTDNARVVISIEERISRKAASAKSKELTPTEIEELVEKLRGAETRDRGAIILNEMCSSKSDLVQAARRLDLPASREDTLERLKDRIIESTIGYRLRSRAIQG